MRTWNIFTPIFSLKRGIEPLRRYFHACICIPIFSIFFFLRHFLRIKLLCWQICIRALFFAVSLCLVGLCLRVCNLLYLFDFILLPTLLWARPYFNKVRLTGIWRFTANVRFTWNTNYQIESSCTAANEIDYGNAKEGNFHTILMNPLFWFHGRDCTQFSHLVYSLAHVGSFTSATDFRTCYKRFDIILSCPNWIKSVGILFIHFFRLLISLLNEFCLWIQIMNNFKFDDIFLRTRKLFEKDDLSHNFFFFNSRTKTFHDQPTFS